MLFILFVGDFNVKTSMRPCLCILSTFGLWSGFANFYLDNARFFELATVYKCYIMLLWWNIDERWWKLEWIVSFSILYSLQRNVLECYALLWWCFLLEVYEYVFSFVLWVWTWRLDMRSKVIMMMFLLIRYMTIELYILYRLCLSQVYEYVKHSSMWYMMIEGMSMVRNQCYENRDYVKGVLTCTHTHTLWMNEWS